MPSSPSRSMSSGTLIGRLNQEWAALRLQTGANDIAARWAREDVALSGLETLPAIENATEGTVDARIDAIFHALVRRASTHSHRESDLAARVVLQLMLPKVVLIARANAEFLRDAGEREQLAVCGMYEAIRTHPPRITHHIPPQLAWTAHRYVRREVRALTRDQPVEWVGELPAPNPGLHPSEELAHFLTWAVAQDVISPVSADLLAERYGSESLAKHCWKSVGDLAAMSRRTGLSPDAIKKRCSRARTRLAAGAAAYVTLADLR
jgi:hypothetical protein